MTAPAVPSYDAYMWPIVERLRAHGRSMTNEEMLDDVSAHMGLSEAVRSAPHGNSGQTEVEYRMAWARTYLKKIGALENSGRGVWTLTPKGAAITEAEVRGGPRQVQQDYAAQRAAAPPRFSLDDTPSPSTAFDAAEEIADDAWRGALMARLLALDPSAFERLCQRLLREAGFSKVEVTGKTGDGGIDGTGVLRMNLLSFQVIFQCKRWQGSVGAPTVRDFRGAMVGRADKGLILTTGTFTAEARREAVRDGAPAIDLVDGEMLCDLLRQHRLGVRVEMVERVTIDAVALSAI
ncbi:restriction endonuclease [Caulobacter sp. 602-1]|uniref:restriction endonuclease n=1 Tax=Caulobacter sp. 602-1 TaxID=2492472 RepID=UPI000F63862D|nr:restriction endonuclease [Caulobacter sp. 602-1]RRN66475.1 restriction endonuclease [Caulobacter sp. 602-1]